MFLSNPFAGAFGLDIGDLSLKLIQLKREHTTRGKRKLSLAAVRSIPLPPGYIVNGEIQQPEMVRRKLLSLLGKEGQLPPVASPWVIADLPEPKTFLKLIEVETTPESFGAEDVLYHARRHLPYEIEETHLDWQLIPESGKKFVRVLIGAAPKVIADSYTYLLESVGLNVLALEIEGLAIARALISRHKDYQGEARAILDLGATRSSLSIYDHGTVQYTATVRFSGELLTTALVQGLHIDHAAAEKLKITYGARYDRKQPKYFKIISPLIDQLAEEIKTSLAYYKERFADANPITHITMCGGQAGLHNIGAILSAKLKTRAEPGNAWKNIAAPPADPEIARQGLTLVSALGLGLRAAEHPLPSRL